MSTVRSHCIFDLDYNRGPPNSGQKVFADVYGPYSMVQTRVNEVHTFSKIKLSSACVNFGKRNHLRWPEVKISTEVGSRQ